MKKSLSAAIVLAAIMAPTAAFAEGYGIIEHHAEGVAMGGAAMFIENDAGNMAYNPAGITLCEGNQIKVSATYIAPHGDYTAVPLDISNPPTFLGTPETGHNRVHPAWAPGAFFVRKMDDKQGIGSGVFSRFGNMCEFEKGSWPATNNQFAKMNGLSITPTYARKSGGKFYWAVGADINYVGLTLERDFTAHPFVGTAALPFKSTEAKGESWALGWNMGLRYAATDKDEFGFAYR
ncbi:MAG: outer membrane protein transport protein, partial [Acidaminococcaceae bacterium]|nr:outer membrane protein transport protein [Acidaminococcaceae bacterium]